jgi:hypothetical protein
MARRMGTITERSKGHYQIRYSLGIDPLTGRRKRFSISIEGTYKDAEREMRRLSGLMKDGCTWPLCWICTRVLSLAGRCNRP